MSRPDRRSLSTAPWWRRYGNELILASVCLLAYANSLPGLFVFDDPPSIEDNPTIRNVFDLRTALSPPAGKGLTVEGRPLVNLSLAIDYARGGLDPPAYHITNILIHLACGLVLCDTLRRTLQLPYWSDSVRTAAPTLAFCVSLLWLTHPLMTAATTYIVQRAESMMSLCYLATFWGLVRGETSAHPRRWYGVSILAACCGVLCKENYVSAPFMLLIFDWMFVGRSWTTIFRQRRWLYVAMMMPLGLLGRAIIMGNWRSQTVGLGIDVSPATYFCSQVVIVAQYLRQFFLPVHQVFSYGHEMITDATLFRQAVVFWCVVAVVLTVLVVRYRWTIAPLIIMAAILAPSSTFIVGVPTGAEYRMYLPAAMLSILSVGGLFAALRTLPAGETKAPRWVLGIVVVASIVCTGLTIRRNTEYYDRCTLFGNDTVRWPSGSEAYNYGKALHDANRLKEAEHWYLKAWELSQYKLAPLPLAQLYFIFQDYAAAQRWVDIGLEKEPNSGYFLYLAARLAAREGKDAAALEAYHRAIATGKNQSLSWLGIGAIYARQQRDTEAIKAFEKCLELQPDQLDALNNLAMVHSRRGDLPTALATLRVAEKAHPNNPNVYAAIGNLLKKMNQEEQANQYFRRAASLAPRNP